MKTDAQLGALVEAMPPITLEEMAGIRLMKRTDSKFVTNRDRLARLLTLAADHYFSQEVAGQRVARYRTVYFDDPERHRFFSMHQCGHKPRTKIRARTYMDSGDSFLEVKRKNNHGKTSKKRIAIPSIESATARSEAATFVKECTGLDFSAFSPTLGNRFQRITLVNREKTERLTIDFGLSFDNFETGREAEMPDVVIIELKRDGRVPSPVLPLLRQLRIKPSGFSKYCIGSCLTNDGLRQNRFKKRLVRIRKAVADTHESHENKSN